MNSLVAERRARCKGRMVIDYVIPDYYARRPKACMGGWGQRFINVMPDGTILPCHAAQTIGHLSFPRFPESSLRAAWCEHPALPPIAAWTGCPTRAAAATTKNRIGAAVAARRWPWPATPAKPTRCANARRSIAQVVALAMRESRQPTPELMLRQRHVNVAAQQASSRFLPCSLGICGRRLGPAPRVSWVFGQPACPAGFSGSGRGFSALTQRHAFQRIRAGNASISVKSNPSPFTDARSMRSSDSSASLRSPISSASSAWRA